MAQDDRGGGKDRMTKKKYVILRESFPNVKDDRRIWLRINSATEESLFAAPRSFADAQDDRGEWLRMTGGGKGRMTKKKYVILRESFPNVKDDRRISLHFVEILR